MDEFKQWRGPIGRGHLQVLASAQGRVFRNNYAAVFITERPPNAATARSLCKCQAPSSSRAATDGKGTAHA